MLYPDKSGIGNNLVFSLYTKSWSKRIHAHEISLPVCCDTSSLAKPSISREQEPISSWMVLSIVFEQNTFIYIYVLPSEEGKVGKGKIQCIMKGTTNIQPPIFRYPTVLVRWSLEGFWFLWKTSCYHFPLSHGPSQYTSKCALQVLPSFLIYNMSKAPAVMGMVLTVWDALKMRHWTGRSGRLHWTPWFRWLFNEMCEIHMYAFE